jgi:hypothetical protein
VIKFLFQPAHEGAIDPLASLNASIGAGKMRSAIELIVAKRSVIGAPVRPCISAFSVFQGFHKLASVSSAVLVLVKALTVHFVGPKLTLVLI